MFCVIFFSFIRHNTCTLLLTTMSLCSADMAWAQSVWCHDSTLVSLGIL
jgi:hypothetical protein